MLSVRVLRTSFFRDDVERAIKNLKCLGGGYGILQAGNKKLVQSVPVELNVDHLAVLSLAEVSGNTESKLS